MLSNQKSSRFYSAKGLVFFATALALLMSVTAFASGNSRFAFIDSAKGVFGLQSSTQAAPRVFVDVPVSLPAVVQAGGVVNVPITVGDLTGLSVISYDFQIDYDPAVLQPVGGPACTGGACFTQTGTLSSTMSVTPNVGFPGGHFIVSAFQGSPLAGGGTLLILNFNIIGSAGDSSALTFNDYTSPSPSFHPGFVFNEGEPVPNPITNGSVSIPAATPTNTDTPTPTNTNTPTATNTATATNTSTPTGTATNTFTPTPTPLCAQVDIEDETTTSGSSVTLSVTTSDTTSLIPPAFSADFRISYDNTILTGVPTSPYGVALGPVGLSNFSTLTVNRQISGSTTTLLISVFGDTPFVGSGDLVTITFPTVTGAPGTFTPVNFTSWPQVPAGFWYNEGAPSVCLQNGSVQILGTVSGRVLYDNTMPAAPFTRPVPGVTMGVTGGFPLVAAGLTDANGDYVLSGFGTGIYTVAPFRSELSAPTTNGNAISVYDAALTAQRVVELITFTAKQNFVANVTQTGQVSSFDSTQMALWAVTLPSSAPVDVTGDWRFAPSTRTYNTPGTYTAEDYLAYLMGDPSGNWCDPTSTVGPACSPAGTIIGQPRAGGPARATAVQAAKLSAPASSDIVVPVSIQGVAEKGIISYQFDLRYDPKVIQPTANAVTLGGTVSSEMSVVVNPLTPGVLRVGVYGPYALSDNGTLLNFHFTAVGNPFDVSPLTWENFMFNEGGIRTNIVDGEVRLTPAVAD